MGFRGSRVELRPLRGLALLRNKSRRPDSRRPRKRAIQPALHWRAITGSVTQGCRQLTGGGSPGSAL
jgi:hypothetical protein